MSDLTSLLAYRMDQAEDTLGDAVGESLSGVGFGRKRNLCPRL